MKNKPEEPTPEQCSSNSLVYEDNDSLGYAIWYPQMGGYCGKAVVLFFKNVNGANCCFEAFVWHDGDFPFCGDEPIELHHCDADQFVDFGKTVARLQGAAEQETVK